jgi:hypothetical protein
MLKVMALVENDGKTAAVLSAAPTAAAPRQPSRVSMRFEMPGGTID